MVKHFGEPKSEPVCAMCGKQHGEMLYEPSRKMLIMGPFRSRGGLHVTMEYRCPPCERKLSKDLLKSAG